MPPVALASAAGAKYTEWLNDLARLLSRACPRGARLRSASRTAGLFHTHDHPEVFAVTEFDAIMIAAPIRIQGERGTTIAEPFPGFCSHAGQKRRRASNFATKGPFYAAGSEWIAPYSEGTLRSKRAAAEDLRGDGYHYRRCEVLTRSRAGRPHAPDAAFFRTMLVCDIQPWTM